MKLLLLLLGLTFYIFIILNIIIYQFGCLITLNMNPLEWLILSTTVGKIILLVIEISLMSIIVLRLNNTFK